MESNSIRLLIFTKDTLTVCSIGGAGAYIGRSARKEGTVVIDSPIVSRLHGHFYKSADGHFRYEDLGSTNGTFADGVLLGVDRKEGDNRLDASAVLSDGSVLRIDAGSDISHPEAVVIAVTEDTGGQIVRETMEIGDGSEVVLAPGSGEQVLLYRTGGGLKISSLSTHGTVLVNNRPINRSTDLGFFDVVKAGRVIIAAAGNRIVICCGEEDRKELSVTIRDRKKRGILQ